MRIKSYFAPSVQQAISLARKEFGEGVTLVTSHVAAAESREFGEYEVVFAIDEPSDNAAAEPDAPPVSDNAQSKFQTALEKAIAAPASPQLNLPEKLDQLRSLFVEIGIEPSMVRALMTMVDRCIPVSQPVSTESVSTEAQAVDLVLPVAPPPAEVFPAEPAASPKEEVPASPGKPKYSAAELAFLSSVSDSQKSAPAMLPDWKFGS